MAPLNFLSLPAELRNAIYSHLTPIDCYTSDCIGLLLSCKQVYYEYEAESTSRMKQLVSSTEQAWSTFNNVPIQFSVINTIATEHNLTLRLPRSMYPGTDEDSGLPICLKPIFLLHLNCLDFGIYDDPAAASLSRYGDNFTPPQPSYEFPVSLVYHLNDMTMLDPIALNEWHQEVYDIPGKRLRAMTCYLSFGDRIARHNARDLADNWIEFQDESFFHAKLADRRTGRVCLEARDELELARLYALDLLSSRECIS